MLMQYATGCFLCLSRAVKSVVNQGLYLFLVLHFFNGACLFKMARKHFRRAIMHPLLTGWGQYPSRIPGPGRLERSARWSVLGSGWQWWGVVVWPRTHYTRRQWVRDRWDPGWRHQVYLEGKLVWMISKRVPMVTDLGLYLVDWGHLT